MPKISEGTISIGALILLGTWLLIGLPWLIYPSERIVYRDNAHPVPQASEAQPKGTAQAPVFVQVIPGPKSAEERAEETEDRIEKKKADAALVRWTLALFLATVGLIVATGALGYFAYAAIRETRRIGEAQVRAYVSIKEARIDFHSEYAHPIVGFIATNSGQSPARNFVWNIGLQYAGDGLNRTVSFNGKWLESTGLDIPAGKDTTWESAHIADMSAKLYIQSVLPKADMCLARVRLDFRYTDVFDRDWFGESYFAAIIVKTADSSETSAFGEQSHWRAGNVDANAQTKRLAAGIITPQLLPCFARSRREKIPHTCNDTSDRCNPTAG
jgi:hypothetical protein